MSIASIMKLRNGYIERHGTWPKELRIGRAMLDRVADDIPQNAFFRHLPEMPLTELSPPEWREHIAKQARRGRLFLFGIRVELCE